MADEAGVVGVGADLEPGTLLAAYRMGLFPMPVGRGPRIAWWSPDPRGVLPLDGLRITRSLRQSNRRYEVRVDTAMKGGCNFPMGPLALLDLVGLDTSLAILDALYAEFRDPNYAAMPLLRRMVTAGQLGRKSGAGFYDYARK